MKQKTINNVLIILGCSVVAKTLSYCWEALLAAYLGANDQADAFYMTTTIFGILYPILDTGIWKVFLPIYKKRIAKEELSQAERFANISISFFFCLSVALVLFMFVFARPIVFIVANGFSSEKQSITIEYLKISCPTYLLMACSSIVAAMLQSHDRFLGSQIREIGTHISKIIFVFLVYKKLGIYAAVIAMIIGSLFRLLVQLPFINWKWKFRPNFHFKDPDVRSMIKGLPAVAITSAIAHINGLVDKMVASYSGVGSVSCLNYGNKLLHVFSGTISSAFTTAVYPTIIQHVAKKEEDSVNSITISVINALLFLIIPISLFCIAFSKELVTVAFQRGRFTPENTALTATIFIGYAIGMLSLGISHLITSLFYAYGDTNRTLIISILEIVLNIIFDLTFYQLFGVPGLAVATSVSSMICLLVRFKLLKNHIVITIRQSIGEMVKILITAIVACGITVVICKHFFHLSPLLTLICSVIINGAVYIGLAIPMKVQSLTFVKKVFQRKMQPKQKIQE